MQSKPRRGETEKAVWRTVGTFVCAVLLMNGVLASRFTLPHVGNLVLMAAGVTGMGICLFWPAVSGFVTRIWKTPSGRGLLSAAAALGAVLLGLFAAVSGCMIAAAGQKPSENATVIVLGAGLRGDRPSKMLADRLEAAADYLRENPQASCIVTGGRSENESFSEAAVMRQYLLELGIEDERLFLEDQSTSTFENIRNARAIIEREGLSPRVAIATQEFHQLRGQSFVRRAGLSDVGACSTPSDLYLLLPYWIREFAGICHMLLLGY